MAWTKQKTTDWLKGYSGPIFYSLVVITETALAIFLDEKYFNFLGLGDLTYAEKWEFLALLATFVLLIPYAWGLVKTRRDVSNDFYFLISMLVLTVAALGILSALWNLNDTSKHFRRVLLVSVAFSVGDFFTWIGVDDSATVRKWATQSYLWFADCPVLFALGMLFYYYTVAHYHQHPGLNWDQSGGKYFLGGAIAFQWMASNIVFIIISWFEIYCTRDRCARVA